jgi:4-amino-4-deoxy-L-arabinose transferase-like glycosyltransferase
MKKQVMLLPIITLAALFLYFFLIPQIPIWSSDEGRFAEIAREMWHLGDFVIPHFNYVDYLDKPILAPLLTTLAFELFGEHSLSARLVPICSGLLGLLLTYYFTAKHYSKRIALFSVAILMTSVGYVLVGRFAVIDMLMAALMSATLFFLMDAYFEKKSKSYLIAYIFIGFSFLTKGLVGIVLPGIIFLFFLVWQRDLKEVLKMRMVLGFCIVCAIILPWLISACLKEPEFFKTFIIEQHFSRFASKSFGRVRPFWFFLPIFFITAFPWTLFFPAAIVEMKKSKDVEKSKLRFLICWMGLVFLFFSIPGSKLPYYLLPLSIPTAIFIGHFLANWCQRESGNFKESITARYVVPFFAFVAIIAAIGTPIYLKFGKLDPQTAILKSELLGAATILFMGGCALLFLIRKNQRHYAFLLIVMMTYSSLLLVFNCMLLISPFQSTMEEVKIIKSEGLLPTDMVAMFSSPDQFSDLPFHLKRRIVIVGSNRGTLTRESHEDDNLEEHRGWFLTRENFAKRFNAREEKIYLLTQTEDLQELLNGGIKNFRILSQRGHKTLIVNTESIDDLKKIKP